jgi:YD repeat-containing protein
VFGKRDPTHKPPPGLSALARLLRSDGGRPCGPEDLGLGFYTLQGWLKGINSERLVPANDMGLDGVVAAGNGNAAVGRDAFGMSLGYYGDYEAIDGNRWDYAGGTRPFAPIGTTGTLTTNHAPLYNGNIAHTVYTLQPFGTGWDGSNTEGQVLAQVYTYDQLNRLKKARGVAGLTNTNTWIGVTDGATNRYRSQYEYDANGNIISANRYDNDGDHYDQFAYKYHKQNGTARLRRNRLYQLFDDADPLNAEANESTDGSEDIGYLPQPSSFDEEAAELNGLHNYHYDALGNLIHDEREQIQAIEWTVAGKVKSVSRTTGSTRKPLSFAYGASGQRILKNVSDPDLDVTGSREHYIRDAQGNIMATYRYTNPGSASLQLNERPLYGSARLGTLGEEMELHSLLNWDPADPVVVDQVDLNYELTDHLGIACPERSRRVCTVVTGRLLDGNGGGTLKQAELVSAQGYEPFGSLLPGRKYDALRWSPLSGQVRSRSRCVCC